MIATLQENGADGVMGEGGEEEEKEEDAAQGIGVVEGREYV